MDFLSNFIKRPMSLVLNNAAAQEETSTESAPSTCEEKSQEIVPSATAEKPQENPATSSSQETPLEIPATSQSVESGPHGIPNTLAADPLDRAAVNAEMHRVGPDKRPVSSPAMLADSSNSDANSNFTKQRIEELLLQFNDNLDQACLNDGTNVDEFLPIQLTPHAAKTVNSKFPATPKTPTKIMSTEVDVAERSLVETSPPHFDQFELDVLPVPDCLPDQFLAYKELGGTTIPALPGDLDVNFDGSLQASKLNFEEIFTPTLTANMHTSTEAETPKKSNIICSPVVSDEETFSDCQSFTPKKETKELNANAEVLNNSKQTENLNMNPEEPDEVHEIELAGLTPEEFMAKYVCEPMDVDISFSNDSPNLPEEQYFGQVVSSTRQPVANCPQYVRGMTISEFMDAASNIVQEEQYCEPARMNLSQASSEAIAQVHFGEAVKLEAELALPPTQKEKSVELTNNPNSIDAEAIVALPTATADLTSSPLIPMAHNDIFDLTFSPPVVPVTEAAKVNENFNLTVDMTSSYGSTSSKGSAPASPTFPIKPSTDVRAFPRSPKKSVVKEPQFLEKSEYAEKLNSSVKQATPKAEIKTRKSCSPVDNHNSTFEASSSEQLNATTVIESAVNQPETPKAEKEAPELYSQPTTEIKITPASPEQAESTEHSDNTKEHSSPEVEKHNSTFEAVQLNTTTDLESESQQLENEMPHDGVLSASTHKADEEELVPAPADNSPVSLPEKNEKRRTFVMTAPEKICDVTFDANSEEMSTADVGSESHDDGSTEAEKEKRRTFTVDYTNSIAQTTELGEKIDAAIYKPTDQEEERRHTSNVDGANVAEAPISDALPLELEKPREIVPKSENSTEEAKRRNFTKNSGVAVETEISKVSAHGEPTVEAAISGSTDEAEEKRLTFVINSGNSVESASSKSSNASLEKAPNNNTTDSKEEKQSNSQRLTPNEQLEIEKQELQREIERQEMLREIQNVNEETAENREHLRIKPSYPVRSPPVPALQKNQLTGADAAALPSLLPPLPTFQHRTAENFAAEFASSDDAFKLPAPPMPSLPNFHADEDVFKRPPPARSPPIPTMMKRRAIHGAADGFGGPTANELSAKEQKQNDLRNEKEDLSPLEACKPARESASGCKEAPKQDVSDEEFGSGLIFNPSDFEYLLSKGNDNVQIDRNSLLLKFDPLFGYAVPVKPTQKQLQQLGLGNGSSSLSTTLEEEERRRSPVEAKSTERKSILKKSAVPDPVQKYKTPHTAKPEKNARMSADVITDLQLDNDCNKAFENSNSQADEKRSNYRMDELEKKIKNEVLKTEDIEKKLKESELREEALIKRITEKDKVISKMNGVIEAYEKTIAEMIAEKEQLVQKYEQELMEVKADRDSNYRHLTSLEMTFSDLHVKYEKSKEMTLQLKANEESLLSERRQHLENMKLQEQRYDKMKNHAMQQLEIANKKLESQTKEHAIESTKLKALLKKEEISRASTNEQLQQKARENAELMKICDELINGQGS